MPEHKVFLMQPSSVSFPVELHEGRMVLAKEKVGRLLGNEACLYMREIESKIREKFMQVQNTKNRLERRNTGGQ